MSQKSIYRFRYVVPFMHYSDNPNLNSYEQINRRLSGLSEWIPVSVSNGQDIEIYAHILKSLDGALSYGKSEKKAVVDKYICSVWKNTSVEKSQCRYINRREGQNILIDFTLWNVEVYLFWNHVGMICFEIGFQNKSEQAVPSVEHIIEFQNFFINFTRKEKSIFFLEELSNEIYDNKVFLDTIPSSENNNDGQSNRRYIKLINDDNDVKYIDRNDLSSDGKYFDIIGKEYHISETPESVSHTLLKVYKTLNPGRWINYIKSTMECEKKYEVRFFSQIELFKYNPQKEYIPVRAIPFIYALIGDDNPYIEQEPYNITYHLANGYKPYYNTGKGPYEYWEHSDGVIWYASRQGCACTTNFGSSYSKHFREVIQRNNADDYYLIYLLQLNQMYGLSYYGKVITERLSADIRKYTTDNKELQKQLQFTLAEINLFQMKSTYTSTSNIQKQNEYFSYIRKQLNIEQDISSLQAGIDGLNALQDSLIQRVTEKKRNTSEKHLSMALALLSLLTVISTINDLKSLFIDSTPQNACMTKLGYILFVFFFIIIIVIAIVFIKNLIQYIGKDEDDDVDLEMWEE